MTFQIEIEAALAKPVDEDLMELADDLAAERVFRLNQRAEVRPLLYTLLLRIRDLEAQVEQERWRDATKEKPEQDGNYLILTPNKTITTGRFLTDWQSFYCAITEHQPTHWKPINLTSVLTK